MLFNVNLALLIFYFGMVLGTPSVEPTNDTAQAFADGQALLAKGEFEAAYKVLSVVVKADPDNSQYRLEHSALRRVMRIRERIGQENDPKEWARQARVLQTFYHSHQIYSEALALDRKLYEQDPSAGSAVLLAESQLALGENSEAAHTLRALSEAQATRRTKILLGIALARQGQIEEARALIREGAPKRDAGRRVLYELARLWAVVGNAAGAGRALSESFALTPAGELEAAKADARSCPDFAGLVDTPEFAKALETQSRVEDVKDSESRRKGCARCGKRARCIGCAKEQGKGTPGRRTAGPRPKP